MIRVAIIFRIYCLESMLSDYGRVFFFLFFCLKTAIPFSIKIRSLPVTRLISLIINDGKKNAGISIHVYPKENRM